MASPEYRSEGIGARQQGLARIAAANLGRLQARTKDQREGIEQSTDFEWDRMDHFKLSIAALRKSLLDR